nr:MAG TPA: hypothetical protein [Caudoviricetes sp.]
MLYRLPPVCPTVLHAACDVLHNHRRINPLLYPYLLPLPPPCNRTLVIF